MLPFRQRDGHSSTYGMETLTSFQIPRDHSKTIQLENSRFFSDIPKQLQPLKHSHLIYEDGLDPETRPPIVVDGSSFPFKNEPHLGPDRIQKTIDVHDSGYVGKYDIFDPVKSSAIQIGEISQNKVIISKYENGTKLAIGVIDDEWIGWSIKAQREKEFCSRIDNKESQLGSLEENEFEDNDLECELQMPEINFINFIDSDEGGEILGVELMQIDEHHSLVGIKTRSSVTVFKVSVDQDDSFQLVKIFAIKSDEFWSMFSHLSFYKSSLHIIFMTIIDVNAQFHVYTYDTFENAFEKVELPYHSFYEPTDVSSFKSCHFLTDDRLILYSRIQIHELNFSNLKFKCRVAGGMFSVFLDFKPIPQRENWFVLLTTKELIVVDATKSFKKVFAWKHSLNMYDKTFFLRVLKDVYLPNNIICVISSRDTNFNHVIQINPIDFKVIDYPNWFFTNNKPLESLEIVPLGNLFLAFQLSPLNELSGCLLKFTSFYSNHEKYGDVTIDKKVHPGYFRFGQLKNEMFFSLISGDMQLEYNSLMNNVIYSKPEVSENENVSEKVLSLSSQQQLQEYADVIVDKVSSFLQGNIKNTSSFQQLYEFRGDSNLGELVDMLEEFIDHYSKSDTLDFTFNLDVWKADMLMKYNNEINNVQMLRGLFKAFLPLLKFNKFKKSISKYISFHLILSTLMIQRNSLETFGIEPEGDKIDHYIQSQTDKLSKDQLDLIDHFEDDMFVPCSSEVFEDTDEPLTQSNKNSQVNFVPMVSSSQKPQTQKKKNKKKKLTSSQFTSSQMEPPSSQCDSQQASQFDSQLSYGDSQSQFDSQVSVGDSQSQRSKKHSKKHRKSKKKKVKRTGF